jgi:hypothetical protein
MSELSGLWTTTAGAPTGDQQVSYTQAQWSTILKIAGACMGSEGVAADYLNELAGTVTGANTVSINTGGAMVDGKWYENGAAVSVTVPSAVGGGNTRKDRIVLRCSWAGYAERITLLPGVDAASPTAPAITQTSGTTYDIPLYIATVTTAGTVTLTDERGFALINTAELADAAVTLAKMAADSVDDTKAGNRVPALTRRQGGSATVWKTQGTTNYTPTMVRQQCGAALVYISAGTKTDAGAITFPVAFSQTPLLLLTCDPEGVAAINTLTASAATITATLQANAGVDMPVTVHWLAIGPE